MKPNKKQVINIQTSQLEQELRDINSSPEIEWLFSQENIKAKVYGPCFHLSEKEKETLLDEKLTMELREFYNNVVHQRANKCKNTFNTSADYIFAFSNERLDNYFNKINVKDLSVLTVGSSGDQAIYALYKGAKEVDLCDLNFMTKVFVELKLAAIKALSYQEFDHYFLNINERFFTKPNYYAKLSQHLDQRTKTFWDTVMIDGDASVLNNAIVYLDIKKNCKFYNSQEEYEKLQNWLKKNEYKINYLFMPFEEISERVDKKYDLIMLSNIDSFFLHDRAYFLKKAKKIYDKNLKNNGHLQLTSAYEDRILIKEKTLNKLYKNNEQMRLASSGKSGLDCLMLIKKQGEYNQEFEK